MSRQITDIQLLQSLEQLKSSITYDKVGSSKLRRAIVMSEAIMRLAVEDPTMLRPSDRDTLDEALTVLVYTGNQEWSMYDDLEYDLRAALMAINDHRKRAIIEKHDLAIISAEY
jgi:hypothetical protein